MAGDISIRPPPHPPNPPLSQNHSQFPPLSSLPSAPKTSKIAFAAKVSQTSVWGPVPVGSSTTHLESITKPFSVDTPAPGSKSSISFKQILN